MSPRVLLACEESQAVTKEFRLLGYEAFSCDIQECSGGHPEWHIKGDVRDVLDQSWDLIVAFPPCTHLACSGARHFKEKIKDGRQEEGARFFEIFTTLECPRVAIENPVGIMSTRYRKPDQIVHPYYFGDPYPKATCLWLKGLPPLEKTNEVSKGKRVIMSNGKECSEWWYNTSKAPKSERGKIRSKFPQGFAKAMATQWGPLVKEGS